jgi:hypothetical protein
MLKLVVLVVVVACIARFFIKGPDDQPLVSLDDLLPATEDAAPMVPTAVYKWQDEAGSWHFSNRSEDAPPGAEVVAIDGSKNVVDAAPTPARSAGAAKAPADHQCAGAAGLTSVAPEQLNEMMQTINNLQETVDQRKADTDKALGR